MADKNPWTDGAETMMKSWTDAQKLMWEGWADMARVSASPKANGSASNPAANPFAGAVQEWQRLTEANMKAWQGQSPMTGNVAQQMMASQGMMMQLLEQTTKAWQMMMPHLNSGGDWQSSLKEVGETFQKQMMEAPLTFMQTTKDSGELWSLYLKEWQKFMPMMGSMGDGANVMSMGMTGNAPMTQMVDRIWSAYESTLGRAVNAPTLGYSRELNAKMLNAFDAWVDVRRAEADYQMLTAQLWVKAFDTVMKKLVERAQQGDMVSSAKDLINTWVSTADDVFVAEFGTQDYIEAQGEYLNATMAYKVRENALREVFYEAQGIPTRRELDETHETIHGLRRELRALKGIKKEFAAFKDELKEGQGSGLEDELETLKAELSDLRKDLDDAQKALKNTEKVSADGVRALESNLPIKKYGDLTIGDITKKLEKLSGYELEQIRAFELLHKNRKTLMQELDRKLQEGA